MTVFNHQQLLEAYYRSESQNIWDRSGSIGTDLAKLKENVVAYAFGHGLSAAFLDEEGS